jgi:hypothetical protein
MTPLRLFLVLLLLPLSFATAAWGLDFSGQSRTYLQFRETTDAKKLLPLYEYLDFRSGSASQNISFHFGGWYRFDLMDESYGSKSTGDLQYAYLACRAAQGNGYVNLGRLLVNQGTAFGHVDGAAAGTDLKGGISVSAFGGLPLETDFDTRSGDSVYGGRISQGLDGLYRIGVSYLKEKNDSRDFREETGIDLWFRPFSKLELLGTSLHNGLTSDWAQHTYFLTIGPFSSLSLRTEFSDVSYKDLFISGTTSALQLLTAGGTLNPLEKQTSLGEELSLSLGSFIVSADYKKYKYDIAGDASSYGGKLSYSGFENGGAGLGIHRMDGETDDSRYSDYRVYAYRKFRSMNLTADVLALKYDAEINGVKNAYSASLAASYALSAKTLVGADMEYARNPYYDKDVRAMLKVVYNFDVRPATTAKGRK